MSEKVTNLAEFRERREPEAVVIPIGSLALWKSLETDEPFAVWLERRVLEDESN